MGMDLLLRDVLLAICTIFLKIGSEDSPFSIFLSAPYEWDRLVVQAKTMEILRQVANEHYRRDVLAASGLRPKQRILFYGPPGTGKTLAAQVLAGVLSNLQFVNNWLNTYRTKFHFVISKTGFSPVHGM